MLRVSEQKSSRTVCRYYASARYYKQGLGIVGAWGGLGADRLGLRGTVSRTSLARLCENRHPATGLPLTARNRDGRTVAYTFRFSVAKSVSILYGLCQDSRLLDAIRSAVLGTMQEAESDLKTRVRKGGQQGERVTGNMVWAEFIHTTASPVRGRCDPQIHVYVCVFNMTWDQEEGCWKAGWFQDVKRDAPYFEAAFRARLAHIVATMGYRVQRTGRDFEIAGVPARVLREFSRRSKVVEQRAIELGITGPVDKRRLGPMTRESGLPVSWTPAYLRREWINRLSPSEARSLRGIVGKRQKLVMRPACVREIVDEVLHRYAGQGAISERRILTEMLIAGMGEVTVEAVRRELAARPTIRVGEGRERALVL